MNETHPTLVPIPDPTTLTTAQLKVAIDNLREFLMCKIELESKHVNERINNNYCLDEKRHRETREWIQKAEAHRLEVKADGEKALAEALRVRKELFEQERLANEQAVAKQADYVNKALEVLNREAKTSHEALSLRIDELKTALDLYRGRHEEHVEIKGSSQWIIGLIIAIVLSLGADIIMVVHIFSTSK